MLPVIVVEEIVYRNGWIDQEETFKSAERQGVRTLYARHMQGIIDTGICLMNNSTTKNEKQSQENWCGCRNRISKHPHTSYKSAPPLAR